MHWKDSLQLRRQVLDDEMKQLRIALSEMATHDANQHEITEAYTDSVFKEIETAQQYWHTKINEWIQITRSVNQEWKPLHDTIIFWTDSIQPNKKP
jgi:hypothetical protein